MSLGVYRVPLRAALPFVLLGALPSLADAQVALPEIVVQTQRPAPPRPTAAPAPQRDSNATLAAQNTQFDIARDSLSPRFGASTFDMNRAFIETLPQGTDAPINSVLLQAPGVSQDSAVNGDIHVRNEHANVQYRINGITLPDGISGFGHVLDTSFAGSIALITGALPAQFGLRTAGIVDIQTQSGNSLQQGGKVGIYGGSFSTLTPSFDYGGRVGTTEYFVSGRGFTSNLGIENPTDSYQRDPRPHLPGQLLQLHLDGARPAHAREHDLRQHHQPIPDSEQPGPNAGEFTAPSASAISIRRMLNENQAEQNTFGVLALQKSVNGLDFQLSAFSRYSTLHFVPDTIGDLRLQRHRFGRLPPRLRQRPAGRRRLQAQRRAYVAGGLHGHRRKHVEQQCLDGAAARCVRQSSRCAVHVLPTTIRSSDGLPASTFRTSGGSPTNSP